MMTTRHITVRYALILGLVALLCTALATAVYWLTKGKIEQVTEQQQRKLLQEVLPISHFDNDLLATCRQITLPEKRFLNQLFIAKKQQEVTAYIVQSTAPDGYSGNIRLLMAIQPDGTVLGVRTLQHKETPGLGDKIETRISDWIYGFSNRQFSLENESEWAVKKDGGQFDQFTGATITPRAVVNNVRQTAKWILTELNLQPEMVEKFTQCP